MVCIHCSHKYATAAVAAHAKGRDMSQVDKLTDRILRLLDLIFCASVEHQPIELSRVERDMFDRYKTVASELFCWCFRVCMFAFVGVCYLVFTTKYMPCIS